MELVVRKIKQDINEINPITQNLETIFKKGDQIEILNVTVDPSYISGISVLAYNRRTGRLENIDTSFIQSIEKIEPFWEI